MQLKAPESVLVSGAPGKAALVLLKYFTLIKCEILEGGLYANANLVERNFIRLA